VLANGEVETGAKGRDSTEAGAREVDDVGPDETPPRHAVLAVPAAAVAVAVTAAAAVARRTSGAGGIEMPPTGLVRRKFPSLATATDIGRVITLVGAGVALAAAATSLTLPPGAAARQRIGTSDDSDTSGEGEREIPRGGERHRLGIGDKQTSVAMPGASVSVPAASPSTVPLLVERARTRRLRSPGTAVGAAATAAPAGATTTDEALPA